MDKITFLSISGSMQTAIAPNTYVKGISILSSEGSPTIRAGITIEGEELIADTIISGFHQEDANEYFPLGGLIYFTFSGNPGLVHIRIDKRDNYFN